MPIGSSLGVTLPTDGASTDTWGSELNTALTTIIDAVETPVTSSGININADVEWNGYEISELGAVKFNNKTSAFTGASNAYKLYFRDNEFYVNDGNGNSIKVTSSGSVNYAATGGFTGDYATDGSCSASYTSATSVFRFVQDPGINAPIDVGDIKLRETVASANAITIKSPSGLASSINRTLLGTNPASTSVLLVSSAGTESSTRDLSIDTVTATTVTGTNVVTGAADVKHGSRVMVRPVSAASTTVGSMECVNGATTTGSWQFACGASARMHWELDIPVGSRLTGVQVYVKGEAGANQIISMTVYKRLMSPLLTETAVSSTILSTASTAFQTLTTGGLTETIVDTYAYMVDVLCGTSQTSAAKVYGMRYTYDRV
jgi:hypothetical protein